MARTPLFAALRHLTLDVQEEHRAGLTRRRVLRTSAAAGASVAAAGLTAGWAADRLGGRCHTDRTSWEVTRAQGGTSGVLVNYTGGTVGAGFGPSRTATQYAQRFLGQVTPVMPALPATWNGRVALDYWTGYPWSQGSYAYWGVGQYTTVAGSEREAVGSCHFAGEHTSVDFQGYLNGAVESGQRAATEIVAALGK
jgi:monoamine oxidase